MRVDVLSIFPGMFKGPFEEGIIRRAREKGLLELYIWDIRDFSDDKHRRVDDYPYGGGRGMVMKPGPFFKAVKMLKKCYHDEGKDSSSERIILLSPQGKLFNQERAWDLASCSNLIFLCGRYEGIDERVSENLATDEISIGDYILTGGELPAMVVIDAVVRLIPGVVGSRLSVEGDSLEGGLLKYPQYTRPRSFLGYQVPEVLLSGNHREIERWRLRRSFEKTMKKRPDLLKKTAKE